MGRSSQQQAAENRTKIVQAASRLFRQYGIDKVSVADIMLTMEMTVGGFYKHFESKEALVVEACQLAFKESAELWTTHLSNASGEGQAPTSQIVYQYLNTRPSPGNCPMIAFAPYMAADSADSPTVEAYGRGTGELLKVFQDGAPCSSTHNQSLALFAAMVGAKVLSQSSQSPEFAKHLEVAVEEMANSLSRQSQEKPE